MAARLHSADELILPVIDAMVAALDPPAADGPLVALVRRQARLIDSMPDAIAVTMLPNHTGQFMKALAELEARAAKRRKPAKGAPSRLDLLRQASAQTYGRSS